MTKAEAIAWYKSINSGDGVNRTGPVESGVLGRGGIAEANWDNGLFTLGIEYGAMIAIIKIFDLKREDLYGV